MGFSNDYVVKVCYNFYDKGAEFCVNYLFENPIDNGTL